MLVAPAKGLADLCLTSAAGLAVPAWVGCHCFCCWRDRCRCRCWWLVRLVKGCHMAGHRHLQMPGAVEPRVEHDSTLPTAWYSAVLLTGLTTTGRKRQQQQQRQGDARHWLHHLSRAHSAAPGGRHPTPLSCRGKAVATVKKWYCSPTMPECADALAVSVGSPRNQRPRPPGLPILQRTKNKALALIHHSKAGVGRQWRWQTPGMVHV